MIITLDTKKYFNRFDDKPNHKHHLFFKGVSIDNSSDEFRLSDGSSEQNVSLSDRFDNGIKNIRKNFQDKKDEVRGLFKKRKIKKIQRDENNKISGFLIAQNLAIEEQDDIIKQMKDKLALLYKINASKDEIIKTKEALIIAEKAAETAKIIAQNGSSHKGFDSIAGYDEEKFILTDRFINLIPFERAGKPVKIPNSILFFGPFGNGKTSFAKAFAYSAGCDFQEAKMNMRLKTRKEKEESLYKDLIGKAQKAQQLYLETGIRTIILFDEIDRAAYEGSFILEKLKRFLEVCSEEYHCTIFATTNNPLTLPSPIRSLKRMPIKVSIDPPNEINAALILEHYLKDCPNVDFDNINLEELAERLCSVDPDTAFNNSQIEDIVKETSRETSIVRQDDLEYKIDTTEPALDKETLDKFKREKCELIGKQ